MVGGQDTNIAAAAGGPAGAIERFITDPVHTSMASEKCQHHSIPIFGQQPFFRIAQALYRQSFSSAELTFHFLTAHYIFLLHVFPDVRSIWGCSECLLQLRAQSSAETPTH